MKDETSILKGAIEAAFTPAVEALYATLERVESVVKHGSGDQTPHGRRDAAGNPAGTTPADRGSQAARADDKARAKGKYADNPRLKSVFDAGATDYRAGALTSMTDDQIKAFVSANSGSGRPVSESELSAYIAGVRSVRNEVHRMTIREILSASPDHPIFRPDTPKVQVVNPKTRRTLRETVYGR